MLFCRRFIGLVSSSSGVMSTGQLTHFRSPVNTRCFRKRSLHFSVGRSSSPSVKGTNHTTGGGNPKRGSSGCGSCEYLLIRAEGQLLPLFDVRRSHNECMHRLLQCRAESEWWVTMWHAGISSLTTFFEFVVRVWSKMWSYKKSEITVETEKNDNSSSYDSSNRVWPHFMENIQEWGE